MDFRFSRIVRELLYYISDFMKVNQCYRTYMIIRIKSFIKQYEEKVLFVMELDGRTSLSLKLEDAIISFNAQVMNLDTVQDLFDASFSYRLVGACGIRFYASAKGQFGAHINTNPKPWDIAAQFLFAELLNLKMTTLDGKAIDHLKGAPFLL